MQRFLGGLSGSGRGARPVGCQPAVTWSQLPRSRVNRGPFPARLGNCGRRRPTGPLAAGCQGRPAPPLPGLGALGARGGGAGRRAPAQVSFPAEQPCRSRGRGTGSTSPRQRLRSGRRGFPSRAGDLPESWTGPPLCLPPYPPPHRANCPSRRRGRERKGRSGRGLARTSHPVPGRRGGGGGDAVRKSRRRGAISLPLPSGQAGWGNPGRGHPRAGGGGSEARTQGPGPDRW